MDDFSVDHVRGMTGCSLFRMQGGRQPGGPRLEEGLEKVELVTAGRCWVEADGDEREATPGTIIWHLPGDRLISRSDERDPYACLVVTWSVDRLVPRRAPRLTRWNEPDAILAYCRQLLTAYSDDRVDRRALALASYADFQLRAHLWASTAAASELPAGLARLLAAMQEDLAQPWPVEAMAEVVGCSPSRLHALFRTHLHGSPHQHLLELRLRRARELLVTSQDGLAVIAARCGLGSAAALCRLFRSHTGTSPGAFRERQF